MHFARRWNHLFHSSAQVDLGMSGTLDVQLRRSQSSVVSSLPETGRNHKERSLANTVGAAAKLHLALIEKVNCCCCCVRTGIVMMGGTKFRRPPRETMKRVSVLSDWLSVCPHEEWWWHDSIFRRNRQLFSSLRRVIFWVFGQWTRPETARPLIASWFPDIDRSKFRHLSALPRSILDGLRWTFAT